jgi:hypothetical protein
MEETEKRKLELSGHTTRWNILSLESAGPGRHVYDDAILRKLEATQRATVEESKLSETQDLANLEESRWKEVYPHYSSRVRVVKANKLWALQMPYFKPVPTNERLDALSKIKEVLTAFKDKSYRYKRSNLRWRHVGLDADNNCVLFDLKSLETGNINEDDITGDLQFFGGPDLVLEWLWVSSVELMLFWRSLLAADMTAV